MADVTFNDIFARSCYLNLYRHGAWSADLVFDGPQAPSEGVTAALKIDDVQWTGKVISSNIIGPDETLIKVVGGAGTFSDTIKADHLTDVNGNQVINRLFQGKGQDIGTAPGSIRNYSFNNYQILAKTPIGKQLSRLLEHVPGLVWRVDNDGTLIITDDASTGEVKLPTNTVIIDKLTNGSAIYQAERLDKDVKPGSTLKGKIIEQVTIDVKNSSLLITVYFDSLAKLFDSITNRLHRDSLQRCYPCTVVAQNGDGTLQLEPDDPRIRGNGLNNVVYRTLPGVTLEVPKNARCFIQFDADDPARPFVSGFENLDLSVYSSNYTVTYGDTAAAQLVALENLTKAALQEIADFINNDLVLGTPVGPTSPGASTPLWPTGAPDVKAKRLKTE